jgi:hypothetical protein
MEWPKERKKKEKGQTLIYKTLHRKLTNIPKILSIPV